MIVDQVPDALSGERLDRVVSFMTGLSRSDSARLIEAGGVEVDGASAAVGKVRLVAGQQVAIDERKAPHEEPPRADAAVEFDVLYEDDAVIVVDKPAGLVVHPGAGNPDGTLVNGLLARFGVLADVGDPVRPGIVHRLDAGSSGLLVVARTGVAAEVLVEQFAEHRATRRYDAVVWGVPEAPHGVIDAPIGRSRSDPLRMAVVADGRRARTEYEVVDSFDEPATLARLRCQLETGRTHQIRVHLSSINHPLVGDPVYGQRRPNLGLSRPFLHAAELAFDHPTTGDRVTFTSPLAADLATWLTKTHQMAAPDS